MQSQNLSQQNYLIPRDIIQQIELEVAEKKAKSKSEVVRRALAAYFDVDSYEREKQLPIRFKNAMDMFEILIILADNDEYRAKKLDSFWLSWPDIMEIKFNRWSFALKAVSIFTKICRYLKHPLQYEQVISEVPIPGTRRRRMMKEGFTLYLEVPITVEILKKMQKEAFTLLEEDDFENKLLTMGSDELTKTNTDVARDHLMNKFGLGGGEEDGEGFDTNTD